MTLLNVRLGYWMRNPNRPPRLPKALYLLFSKPFWHLYMLREMFGWGMDENGCYLHLSDGGHFENLGLYELVRRKCRDIFPDLPEDIYGYKRANPDFPDQTTSDQFFDEAQFEAYRELNYGIGRYIFEKKSLEGIFPDEKKPAPGPLEVFVRAIRGSDTEPVTWSNVKSATALHDFGMTRGERSPGKQFAASAFLRRQQCRQAGP